MTEALTELARAGGFDDIPIYALADGSRLKVWDGEESPDSSLVNLWLDPADEILKRYDSDDGWVDAGIVGATGEIGPEGPQGEQGGAGPRGEQGADGEKGNTGERGPRGLEGEKGEKGNTGEPGPRGKTGEKGDRGSKGERGDAGERGARGPRGYSVLSGRRDPDSDDGKENDFWINTVTAYIFGPKTDGEWGEGMPLRGSMGPRGLSGSPGPGVAVGGEAGQLLSKIDATDYNTEWVDAPEGTGGTSDHGDLDGLLDDDHPQYHNDARGDARYSLLAHEHDHITPLVEDSRDEADGITAYPTGVSSMKVSEVANWDFNEAAGTIVTNRTGDAGHQTATFDQHPGYFAWRVWDSIGLEWSGFTYAARFNHNHDDRYSLLAHEHDHIEPLVEDAFAEADPITGYPLGISIMPVTAGLNFGPNASEAGHVLTERVGSSGKQTFAVPSTETSYTRYYTGGAWGSWSSGGGSSDAATLEGEDGAYYLDRTNHTSTQDLATITGHDKAAHDALDIDADTLDGHDTAYFATATGLSDHLGDTTDAHDATAISYAGSTNVAATDVEAAIDELDTEKATTGSVTTVQTNLTDHINDATDAHDASAVSYAGGTGMSATDVEAAIDELATEKANAGAAPATHATTHTNGTDDIQNATAAQKGLATAAQITKLDGIETGATADQTAAEILTAVKTVDGTGSGLDADLLDGISSTGFVQTGDYEDLDVLAKVKNVDGAGSGLDADLLDGNSSAFFATATGLSDHLADAVDAHDASAISYAGSTNVAATDVEGAIDELDTEKLAAASYTAADVLSKILTVDGSGSGLDADLLDGNSSAFYATATGLSDHLADAVDAHDASAVSFSPTGTVASTDVQSAIAEVASEAAAFSLTEVEVDLGSNIVQSGSFQITGLSGLTAGRHVLIRQASGPYTGKGTLADEFEMDSLSVSGKATNATTIQCYWKSDGPVRGNFKFAYAAG